VPLGLVVAVVACAEGRPADANGSPGCELRSAQALPSTPTIEVGESLTFQVAIQQRNCVDVPFNRFWTSTAPAIAAVDPLTGLAVGVSPGGPVFVRVNVQTDTDVPQGVVDSARLTVVAPTVAAITLDPSALGLLVGQTRTVVPTSRSAFNVVVTNAAYTWQSSDPAVATVTPAGLITAMAPGATTVRVSSNTVQAIVAVSVSPVPVVPVASVTVTPATQVLVPGGTIMLSAATRDSVGGLLTGRTVIWSTNAASVAAVSTNGVVTAVAPGTAVVTATSEGRSGTATITVTPPPVSSVTVTPTTAQLFVNGTQALVATARDASGNVLTGETVGWSSSAPVVASVSGAGLITALSEGTTTVTATVRGVIGTATIDVRAPRIAYALIDQPSASTQTTAAESQFNGMGGPLTVVRTNIGRYTVTVPGAGSASDARLPFVSPVGGLDVACFTTAWSFGAPGDGTVIVECRGGSGAFVDSRFALLVLGAHALPGALAFGSTLGMTAFPGPATSSFSTGAAVSVRRDPSTPQGRFHFEHNTGTTGARGVLVTAVGGPTPQCVMPGFGPVIDVFCQVNTTPADAPFNAAIVQQGRPGLRFATGNNGATSAGAPSAPSTGSSGTINSSGGAITTVRTSAGVYRMTLQGLARGTGAGETVMLSTWHLLSGSRCVVHSWQSLGNDLVVDVNCFSPGGAAADVGFQVLVIE